MNLESGLGFGGTAQTDGDERLLPIPEPVADILGSYRASVPESGPGDYVFINRNGEPFTDYGQFGDWGIAGDAAPRRPRSPAT